MLKVMPDSLPHRRRVLPLLCLALFVQLSVVSDAPAQSNDSIFYHVPVARIRRKPKPNRHTAPNHKPVIRAPYLALQLKLFKLNEDGTPVETNPLAVFHPGDRLRLGVRANQRGYLTIIHQEEMGSNGQILFPTSQLNHGGNYIDANKDFIVPSNCPSGMRTYDCAYPVQSGVEGELFTIIFSRDMITNLPETATTSDKPIPATVIDELEKDSSKLRTVPAGTQASPYAVVVMNDNSDNNEEIVKRFPIHVAGGSPAGSPTSDTSPSPLPTDAPAPVIRNDNPSPTYPGTTPTASVTPEPQRDRSSLVLIVIGMVGVAGVVLLLVYIFAAGRGLGR